MQDGQETITQGFPENYGGCKTFDQLGSDCSQTSRGLGTHKMLPFFFLLFLISFCNQAAICCALGCLPVVGTHCSIAKVSATERHLGVHHLHSTRLPRM